MAFKEGQGNLSLRGTEATAAPTQRSGRGAVVSPGARSLESREMLNTNLASLAITLPGLAGLQEKPAASLPRPRLRRHGTTHAKTPSRTERLRARRRLSDARDARLRLGFGKVGATLGPAARGILGCEQGPPERCDSNCRQSNITSQTFSVLCLPGDLFLKCSV